MAESKAKNDCQALIKAMERKKTAGCSTEETSSDELSRDDGLISDGKIQETVLIVRLILSPNG